jgi:hypothetical protein
MGTVQGNSQGTFIDLSQMPGVLITLVVSTDEFSSSKSPLPE